MIETRTAFFKILIFSLYFHSIIMQGMSFFNREFLKDLMKEAVTEERLSRNLFSKAELKADIISSSRELLIFYGVTGLTLALSKLAMSKLILYRLVQKTKSEFKTTILANEAYNKPLNNEQKRIMEESKNISTLFMGKEGSGKTFIMANVARGAQKDGSTIYWINPFTFFPSRTTELFNITQKDIFNAIINDAKREALKNKKLSYILIDELHRSPLYNAPMLDVIFLEYLNNQTYKKNIITFATTNDTNIHPELYREGRFELKVIFTGDEEFDEPFVKAWERYQRMKGYAPALKEQKEKYSPVLQKQKGG